MIAVLTIVAFVGWGLAVILFLLALDLRLERDELRKRGEYMRRTLLNSDRPMRERRGVDSEPWDDWAEEPTFVDKPPRR